MGIAYFITDKIKIFVTPQTTYTVKQDSVVSNPEG